MRFVYRIILPFVLVLIYGTSLATEDWIRVKLDDKSTIEFPRIPELLDGEDMVMMACADTFGLYYSAVIGPLPQAAGRDTGKSGLITMYRGLAERKVETDTGQMVKISEFEYLGVPGIDLFYSKGDSEVLGKFIRFWYKDSLLYKFEVWFTPGSAADVNPLKTRYFNSFIYKEGPSDNLDAIRMMIRKSFTALVIGFIGIIIMTFVLIRRRSRRRTHITT